MKWKERGYLLMNKVTTNYFKNLFLKKKKLLILYFFVCFMAYPFVMFTNLLTTDGVGDVQITVFIFNVCLFVLGIFAIVLPIFTFKFSLTKRHVDTYYAIPINRDHLFKTHFIAPILGVCVPILINYLIGGLLLLVNHHSSVYVYFNLLLILLMAFAVFVMIYSINTFFVLKCNNVLDACIISAAVTILPIFVFLAVNIFLSTQTVNNGMVSVSNIPDLVLKLLSPMNGLVVVSSIVRVLPFENKFLYSEVDWIMMGYYLVLGCGAVAGAYFIFKNKKGESAEQLTTDFVTYPLLSNIALASLILCFNLMGNDLTVNILIVISLFVIFFIVKGIARRSMKLTPMMVAEFVILMVLFNGFNFISRNTEFFGINRQVIDYSKYRAVTFEFYGDEANGCTEILDKDVQVLVKNMDENDKALFDYIEVLQNKASLNHKMNNGYYYVNDYCVTLDIVYSNGSNDNRMVYFYLDKEDAASLNTLINQIKE